MSAAERWPHLKADICTLRNGGEDDPEWEDVLPRADDEGGLDFFANPIGWNIFVADGQVCAFVPFDPQSTGEPSDGGPLTDWRDAICRAGRTLSEMSAHIDAQAAQIRGLEAEREECRAAVPLGEELDPLPFTIRQVFMQRDALDASGRSLVAEVERLRRVLAVERGDESQAPEGWRLRASRNGRWWLREDGRARLLRLGVGAWEAQAQDAAGTIASIGDDVYSSALEAMEALEVSDV